MLKKVVSARVRTLRRKFNSLSNRVSVGSKSKAKNIRMLNSGVSIMDFLKSRTYNKRYELLFLFFIDDDDRIVDYAQYTNWNPDRVDVPYDRIFAKAVKLKAPRVVVAHNHPGGGLPDFSIDDIEVLMNLQILLGFSSSYIEDFIVLTENGSKSMKKVGHLDQIYGISKAIAELPRIMLNNEEFSGKFKNLLKEHFGV
ncbi:MAG: JAB domain-containing protein [Candidatus Caldarchaeum sp.]